MKHDQTSISIFFELVVDNFPAGIVTEDRGLSVSQLIIEITLTYCYLTEEEKGKKIKNNKSVELSFK